jgi:transposase
MDRPCAERTFQFRTGQSYSGSIPPGDGTVPSGRRCQPARIGCQAAYRLHVVLCEILPGGVPRAITASAADALLASVTPAGPVAAARHQLAAEYAPDLRQLDDKLRETRKKITPAVRTSGTMRTEIFGVGPVVAATILGDVATPHGSPP